ncbi:MAG: hypothetical protein ABW252_24550 [Polyangiales bacterium]
MELDPVTIVALVAGLVVVAAIFVMMARHRARQRSEALREHFGPEYERAIASHGDRTRAERDLVARQKRLDELDIRPLSAEQCERFGAEWAGVQQRFVDDPRGAVSEADSLVKQAMRARGYPMGDFEQRVADLSVEHASTVDHYRAARTIARSNDSGTADTEDLRQAMVHYRALFNDLLEHTQVGHAQLRQAHA